MKNQISYQILLNQINRLSSPRKDNSFQKLEQFLHLNHNLVQLTLIKDLSERILKNLFTKVIENLKEIK